MSCAPQFRWTSAFRSHVGRVREINEDACLDLPERGLWAVADGMGGHARGDFASRSVVDALNELAPPRSLAGYVAQARGRLQSVNRRLRAEAASRNVPIIGSTVVVLLVCDPYCGYLWAGDSRIYLCRNGGLRRLTRDHSQVEELRARGDLAAEEAVAHPARNIITRAIGATASLDLDEGSMKVDGGDMFLLCSDGLSNAVDEQDLLAALAPGDCRQAAEFLVDAALARGGHDNISAVVVRAEELYNVDQTVMNPAL